MRWNPAGVLEWEDYVFWSQTRLCLNEREKHGGGKKKRKGKWEKGGRERKGKRKYRKCFYLPWQYLPPILTLGAGKNLAKCDHLYPFSRITRHMYSQQKLDAESQSHAETSTQQNEPDFVDYSNNLYKQVTISI